MIPANLSPLANRLWQYYTVSPGAINVGPATVMAVDISEKDGAIVYGKPRPLF
jgi:hypothetical protein